MATLQKNKVVIYSHRSGSTSPVRAHIVTVAADGTLAAAQVGAGHADLDTARNAVYATEDLTEIHSEVHVSDVSLVGA